MQQKWDQLKGKKCFVYLGEGWGEEKTAKRWVKKQEEK